MTRVLLCGFTLFLCINMQGKLMDLGPAANVVEEHLREHAKVFQEHHDNIDADEHTHSHKHSEDGEEHEHHHAHKKPSTQDVQFFLHTEGPSPDLYAGSPKNGFREINLVSSSFPNQLFRPPIA